MTTAPPGTLPAAGGRGRSFAPECAAPVASTLAGWHCTPSMASSANRGCAATFSFYRSFSSRSSWRGAAERAGSHPAVAYGFLGQSAGMENRPLSLGRDFIDEIVVESPLMSRHLPGNCPDSDFGEVRGMHGDAISLQVADAGRFKVGKLENRPLPDGTSEHFL